MVIDVTGFGWSGSAAYLDLLKEYDDVQFPNGSSRNREFTFLYVVDGIADLEFKLMNKHCRIFDSEIAIRRFLNMAKHLDATKRYQDMFSGRFYTLCEKYINQLGGIRFKGRSFVDSLTEKEPLSNIVRMKVFGNRYTKRYLPFIYRSPRRYLKLYDIAVCYCPENFLPVTQSFVMQLLDMLRDNTGRSLVTDHMFSPDNPLLTLKYFKDPTRCIIVRRDPRDTYILAKKVVGNRVIPIDTVENFIWFYRHTIEKTKIENTENVMSVNFEDIVYRYDKMCLEIERFCHLGEHKRPFSFLNPEVSANNTQLYKLYTEYSKDIEMIEKELPDSLFDFDSYGFLPNRSTSLF